MAYTTGQTVNGGVPSSAQPGCDQLTEAGKPKCIRYGLSYALCGDTSLWIVTLLVARGTHSIVNCYVDFH